MLFLQVERKFAHEEFILFLHWTFCVWLLKVLEKQRPKVSESKKKEKMDGLMTVCWYDPPVFVHGQILVVCPNCELPSMNGS